MDFGVGDVGDADPAAGGGADAAFAAPPRPPLPVDLAGLEPEPDGQDGADVGEPDHRWFPGAVGQAEQPHPGRGEPAPGRSFAQGAGFGPAGVPPAGQDAPQPVRLHVQGGGEQVDRGAVLVGDQGQAGDVPVGEFDRPGVTAARRVGWLVRQAWQLL